MTTYYSIAITYQVTIQLFCGNLDVEVHFSEGSNPTDDEIYAAAVKEIKQDLSDAKLGFYNKVN